MISIFSMKEILKNYENRRIAIVGDIMLDHYVIGNVDRISPEAPVPVLRVSRDDYRAGGAGNVALNLANLKASPYLIGLVGNDYKSKILKDALEAGGLFNLSGIISSSRIETIEKTRVVAQGQQIVRVDRESNTYTPTAEERNKILSKLLSYNPECIILSDYGKGIMEQELVENIKDTFSDVPIFVDPKPKNRDLYKDVFCITPNEKEAREMTKETKLLSIGTNLENILRANILITRGEKGMTLYTTDGQIYNLRVEAREVFDVSGAGDTVIATLALSYIAGATLVEAMTLANKAAGIVVGKHGTVPVKYDELESIVRGNEND